MPDFITLGLTAAGVAFVPIGAFVKKSYNNEHRITTLEANYENVDKKLDSVEEKIDRLIERFLPHG